MKALLSAVIWIDLLACCWIIFQFPIIKTTTSNALAAIEDKFIRPELSDEERGHLESLKQRIEANQTAVMDCLTSARVGAISIGGILLIQNLALMAMLRTLKRAEPNSAGQSATGPLSK